jgi:hypothetical protein
MIEVLWPRVNSGGRPIGKQFPSRAKGPFHSLPFLNELKPAACMNFAVCAWPSTLLKTALRTRPEKVIVERFFRSPKEECVWQHNFGDFAEARTATTNWIHWYNAERRTRSSVIAACASFVGYSPNSWFLIPGERYGGCLHGESTCALRFRPE